MLSWPHTGPPSIDAPVSPIPAQGVPMAGQTYFIDCIVKTPGLTNDNISWAGPDSFLITATSGRVSVGDVTQDSSGRSVRRLSFNPLSTEDSGPYTCISPQGPSLQTITVNGISCVTLLVVQS